MKKAVVFLNSKKVERKVKSEQKKLLEAEEWGIAVKEAVAEARRVTREELMVTR